MANDITLFLGGAFCAYFVYCFLVYFERSKTKFPEIGSYYRMKDDPWSDELVVIIDVKEGHVKYGYYIRGLGVIGKSTMKISSFFYVYKKNEDQNINIESQS